MVVMHNLLSKCKRQKTNRIGTVFIARLAVVAEVLIGADMVLGIFFK